MYFILYRKMVLSEIQKYEIVSRYNNSDWSMQKIADTVGSISNAIKIYTLKLPKNIIKHYKNLYNDIYNNIYNYVETFV